VDDNLLPFGRPRPERADAARNREHLLAVAREMIAEDGVDKLTMDGLAERAGLGKGTVFRRFKTRAGIFAALITDDENAFQRDVLSGPPPLGPGADPVTRLIAYGRARIGFLFDHHGLARGTLERHQSVPANVNTMPGLHIRVLLAQAQREGLVEIDDLTTLTVQLTAALEGPLLLYLATEEDVSRTWARRTALADGWQFLIERIAGFGPGTGG
jgi:AcrR family transcriptional regulator